MQHWMRISLATFACLAQVNKTESAPSTSTFMNVLSICAAGLTVKIDANLQGSLRSVYDGELTKGKATQEIIPEITKLFPNGITYERYVDCIKSLINDK